LFSKIITVELFIDSKYLKNKTKGVVIHSLV